MSLNNRINRCWRLWAAGDAEGLLDEIDEMGSFEPRGVQGEEVLFLWALGLWRAGKTEEAAEKLNALLAINPRSAAAHLQRANILDDLERFEEAEKHYVRAAELTPDASGVYSDWGIMLCRADDQQRAMEKFETAERLGADDDNLQLYCALSLEALGDLETACERLEKYLERGRREGFAIARLGAIYMDLGRLNYAEPLLREACDIEPEQRSHRFCLAECLKRMGELGEAEEICRMLLENTPDCPETSRLLGDIEFQRGNLPAARRNYERSLHINAVESYALSGLAQVDFCEDNVKSAEQLSLKAIASDAGNCDALDLLRESRPKLKRLARYTIEIRGESDNGLRFYKSIDCLAENESQASQYVQSIQTIFTQEIWWEFGEVEFDGLTEDDYPGVCWISEYEIVEELAQ